MHPTHDQITDATNRFVDRCLARIARLEDTKAKLPPSGDLDSWKTKHPAMVKLALAVLASTPLRSAKCSVIGCRLANAYCLLNGTRDEDMAFEYQITGGHRLIVSIADHPALAQLRAIETARREILAQRGKICTEIEGLRNLSNLAGLAKFGTFLRRSWSPATKTERMTDTELGGWLTRFKDAQHVHTCEL